MNPVLKALALSVTTVLTPSFALAGQSPCSRSAPTALLAEIFGVECRSNAVTQAAPISPQEAERYKDLMNLNSARGADLPEGDPLRIQRDAVKDAIERRRANEDANKALGLDAPD